MITAIIKISSEKAFKNLSKNLFCLEPDIGLGVDVLCLVPKTEPELYLSCRNLVLDRIKFGESRVVSIDGDDFKYAFEYLTDKNEYVFLLDCNYVLPFGGVGKLYKTYLENRNAGFIAAHATFYGGAFYWVKDVYGYPDFIGIGNKTLDGLVDVDICEPRGVMTKTRLFKEVFCSPNVDGGFDYSFGIKLRRQGYKNYINSKVVMTQVGG